MSEERDGMVLYWRPGCTFCMALWVQLQVLRLRFRGLRWSSRNIWRDDEARGFVRSVADGNETVPTVTVAGHPMVNPSARRVLAKLRSRTPHLVERAEP